MKFIKNLCKKMYNYVKCDNYGHYHAPAKKKADPKKIDCYGQCQLSHCSVCVTQQCR